MTEFTDDRQAAELVALLTDAQLKTFRRVASALSHDATETPDERKNASTLRRAADAEIALRERAAMTEPTDTTGLEARDQIERVLTRLAVGGRGDIPCVTLSGNARSIANEIAASLAPIMKNRP